MSDIPRETDEKTEIARLYDSAMGAGVTRRQFIERALVLGLSATALGSIATACGSSDNGGTTTTEGTPKPGGVYNWSMGANPPYIDPVGASETEGWQIVHNVFEGLVMFAQDESGGMVVKPKIAESWEPNDDASVWTFRLKKGVKFQTPVSREVVAQDFVDSLNRAADPKLLSTTAYIINPIQGAADTGFWENEKAGLTGVKALDDSTLEITLKYPFAEFIQTMAHVIASVTPVEYIDKIGAKAYNKKPVGTGPFMVKEFKNNQYVDLVKNPDYWDPDNAPYLDEVMCKLITADSTQWLEFQKGSIDFTVVPPGQVAVAEAMPQVKSGEWTAKKWPNLGTYWYGFNMNNPTVGTPAGDTGFSIRKAFVYSADAENVINVVNEGVDLPATGICCVGLPGFIEDQSPYAFDPEAAKKIVADLGTVPTFRVWYNTDEGHQKVAEVLQAGWQAVGLKCDLSNIEWGTYLDKLLKSEKGDASSSEIFRMGWTADYPSLDNFLYPLFESSQSMNYFTFYNNPEFDDVVAQARQTTDEKQRWNLYHQAEKIVLTDAPLIPIYFYRNFRVTNNRIGGFNYDPMMQANFWEFWVK